MRFKYINLYRPKDAAVYEGFSKWGSLEKAISVGTATKKMFLGTTQRCGNVSVIFYPAKQITIEAKTKKHRLDPWQRAMVKSVKTEQRRAMTIHVHINGRK
jgi:hypothetical protein